MVINVVDPGDGGGGGGGGEPPPPPAPSPSPSAPAPGPTVPNGPATLGDIQAAYGGPLPAVLGNYYAGGPYVSNPAPTSQYQTGPIPTSGPIDIGFFFGTGPTPVPPPPPPAPSWPATPFGVRTYHVPATLYTNKNGVSGGFTLDASLLYYDGDYQPPGSNALTVDWKISNVAPNLVASEWRLQYVTEVSGDVGLLTYGYVLNDAETPIDIPNHSGSDAGPQCFAYLGHTNQGEEANQGVINIRIQIIFWRKSDNLKYVYADVMYISACTFGGTIPEDGG